MTLASSIPRKLAAAVLVCTLALTSVAMAERERVPGYVTDSAGNMVHDGSGECVRSSTWTPDKAVVVGCDGVVLKAPVEIVEGGGTGDVAEILIPAAAMFAVDSAELTEEGKQDLEAYRAKIRPELTDAFAALIIGHTDNTGNPKYNEELSLRRAAAVRDFLIAGGAPPEKLRIVGMGRDEPLASNDTKEGRAQNRRVEVFIYGEVRALDAMRFPSVALFPRRSSELTADGKKMLDEKLQQAKESLSRAAYIEIVGHTDDVGDPKDNQKLSEERAQTVRDALAAAGVDPKKMTTVGVGPSYPIASNQTDEGRAQNRRVEVLVLGRLKEK